MIDKYFKGVIPDLRKEGDFDEDLKKVVVKAPVKVEELLDKLQFSSALMEIWKAISRTNKYIDETMPWILAKDEAKKDRLAAVLYNLTESLRIISILIQPFMPETPKKIWEQLGIKDSELVSWESTKVWGRYPQGGLVTKGEAIFPRIDINKELEELEKINSPKNIEESGKNEENLISIDEFAKIDLRVAKVLEAEKVEGTDKLLKLKLEMGGEIRQVVSGIAKNYSPGGLLGKYVVLVANLKPVRLRGIESQGMILAASDKDSLSLVTIDKVMDTGIKIT